MVSGGAALKCRACRSLCAAGSDSALAHPARFCSLCQSAYKHSQVCEAEVETAEQASAEIARRRSRTEKDPSSLAPIEHQANFSCGSQALADQAFGQSKHLGQVAFAYFPRPDEEVENAKAKRVGKRFEQASESIRRRWIEGVRLARPDGLGSENQLPSANGQSTAGGAMTWTKLSPFAVRL